MSVRETKDERTVLFRVVERRAFDSIRPGATELDVQRALGKPEQVDSVSQSTEHRWRYRIWDGERRSFFKSLMAPGPPRGRQLFGDLTFQGGRVTDKHLWPATNETFAGLVGEYYLGDGLGLNWTLSVKPDHTFSFAWTGCLGEYGAAEGSWSAAEGRLTLRPRHVKDDGDKLPLVYTVIRWGPRVYLVPPEKLVDFCNVINHGWEPRRGQHGRSFLRTDDWKQKANGKPDLPRTYCPFCWIGQFEPGSSALAGMRVKSMPEHARASGSEWSWSFRIIR